MMIHLEDDLAREVEECARREHKSVSEWVKERVKPGADRASALAAMEATARANGYPAGWPALFGSLADAAAFAPPLRSPPRVFTSLGPLPRVVAGRTRIGKGSPRKRSQEIVQ